MTPEEIQQARELAQHLPRMGYAVMADEAELLSRAVLALTEQLAEANAVINTKLHLSDLTEQQPEPTIDGFPLSEHPAARAHQAILSECGVAAGEMFHRAVLDELDLTLAQITSREVELLVAATAVHRRLAEQQRS